MLDYFQGLDDRAADAPVERAQTGIATDSGRGKIFYNLYNASYGDWILLKKLILKCLNKYKGCTLIALWTVDLSKHWHRSAALKQSLYYRNTCTCIIILKTLNYKPPWSVLLGPDDNWVTEQPNQGVGDGSWRVTSDRRVNSTGERNP